MTVKELYEKCREAIENENGDRDIVLCVNDNKFYALEGGFSSPIYNSEAVYELLDEWGAEEDTVIVLN